ncbi:ABC transporter ATP-binding protein [Candidatus Woesearchaeota archaeon]|nr:ABC transporter ATP-binding protein [Candidatus Woesearchaeota archaeon]
MAALLVDGLCKAYVSHGQQYQAVNDISFQIAEGEMFGLLGPNGAGKTTTINIIAGILKKDKGTIRILGKDPEHHHHVRTQMNICSAYFGLSDILSVNENLQIYARLYHVQKPQQKIDALLATFGMLHLRHKKTNTLSSGERTRLSLCKGLLNDPKLLLLDECTVGLDPDIAERTRNVIKEYQQKHKAAILFTSHYMYEVEALCDRIAFLINGKIIKIDTADKLKELIKMQQVEIYFLNADKNLKKLFQDKGIDVLFLNETTVRFDIHAKGTRLYALMNTLFKNGYKISDLRIKRPTLEDVFIKITRHAHDTAHPGKTSNAGDR